MARLEPDGVGGWVWDHTLSRVIPHLSEAGVLPYLTPGEIDSHTVRGTARLDLIPFLERHDKFQCGILHGLHVDVGQHRRDFRSFRGAFGKGFSVQIVVDEQTGAFYADLDKFSPYADVVNWMGHAGEVIGGWFRRRRA